MWSEPVTFGGGMTIAYGSPGRPGSAWKSPRPVVMMSGYSSEGISLGPRKSTAENLPLPRGKAPLWRNLVPGWSLVGQGHWRPPLLSRSKEIPPKDGVTEAIEAEGARFVVGVQWHPERIYDRLPHAAALFRALVEATAFGARAIIERLREHGVPVERVVCCGGIAEKNPLLMQIYVIYFVLPAVGLSLPAAAAGVAALSLNAAAYIAEIFRGGIESIDDMAKVPPMLVKS